jgi:glucose/arabinose dehydrogenase
MNTWPKGYRHAILPSEHEEWNRSHYPGTRQLCSECGQPTGRCEDDTIFNESDEPICEDCYELKGTGDVND